MGWKEMSQQKRTLLLLMMAFAAFMFSDSAGNSVQALSYVNNLMMDPFFTVLGQTFDKDDAITILYRINECNCRSGCFTLGNKCSAWSYIRGRDTADSECRITNKGPEMTNLTTTEGATYYFKESSVKGTYFKPGDNLFYVELESMYHFQEAKSRCASIPGHRLIIVHSDETYNFLRNHDHTYSGHYNYFWIDLQRINETTAQWGDGTYKSLDSPEIRPNNLAAKLFEMHSKQGYHYVSDALRVVLCQSNPYGIEW